MLRRVFFGALGGNMASTLSGGPQSEVQPFYPLRWSKANANKPRIRKTIAFTDTAVSHVMERIADDMTAGMELANQAAEKESNRPLYPEYVLGFAEEKDTLVWILKKGSDAPLFEIPIPNTPPNFPTGARATVFAQYALARLCEAIGDAALQSSSLEQAGGRTGLRKAKQTTPRQRGGAAGEKLVADIQKAHGLLTAMLVTSDNGNINQALNRVISQKSLEYGKDNYGLKFTLTNTGIEVMDMRGTGNEKSTMNFAGLSADVARIAAVAMLFSIVAQFSKVEAQLPQPSPPPKLEDIVRTCNDILRELKQRA